MKRHFARLWPVYLIAVVALAAYLTLSLARWHRMASPSWDLAIFEQAVRGWAFHGVPTVDIKGPGANQLGDHFSPLLVLLAPFYRLFPSPVTLVVLQCILVAVSIVPLGATAVRMLGRLKGAAVAFAYAASFGLANGIDVQFHEYALAVPILSFGLAAFLANRYRTAVIVIALLLGVKEDLGFTVAAFGLVLWLRGKRRLGLWTGIGGIAAAAVTIMVIIPFFRGQTWEYWGRFDKSSDSSPGLFDLILGFFGPGTKWITLLLLIAVGAGVCLFSPIMLMVVPTLGWRFIAPTPVYWGTGWHYNMILMPIVIFAALDGIARLRSMSTANDEPVPAALSGGLRSADTRVDPALQTSRVAELRGGFRSLIARVAPFLYKSAPWIMLLVAGVSLPFFPLHALANSWTYESSPREPAAREALRMIPDGKSVATDAGLISQLTSRCTVYWIGGAPSTPPDYVLLDGHASWNKDPNLPGGPGLYAEGVYPNTTYRTIFQRGGYGVAERVK